MAPPKYPPTPPAQTIAILILLLPGRATAKQEAGPGGRLRAQSEIVVESHPTLDSLSLRKKGVTAARRVRGRTCRRGRWGTRRGSRLGAPRGSGGVRPRPAFWW